MSTLTDIIDRLKTDPRHEKSLVRLRAFCKDDHGQDLACVPPDGLDANKIATAKEKLEEVGAIRAVRGAYKDYLTFDEWQAKGKGKAPPCDPSIGILDNQQVPLIDGISQDTAGIDWSAVPSDRLVLVLHGRESGALDRTPGPSLRRQWARELATGETGDWAPLRKEYDALRPGEKERLADMLAYKRPAKVQVPELSARRPAESHESSITIGGSSYGNVIMTGNGNQANVNVGMGAAAPLVMILASGAQGNAGRGELVKHLASGERAGRYRIWSGSPFGANIRDDMRQTARAATIIAVIMTTDLLNDEPILSLLADRRQDGARIVPVRLAVLGDFQINDTPLAGLVAVPRGGFIVNYSHKDEAWSEVTRELRAVLESPRS